MKWWSEPEEGGLDDSSLGETFQADTPLWQVHN